MSIDEHIEKMNGMTCAQKTRYVLEFVLHEKPPFTKSKYWNKVYKYFYWNMYYQKALESNRKSMNKRSMLLRGRPHTPTPRLRVPPQFNSKLEYYAYANAGKLRSLRSIHPITLAEACESHLTIRTK